MAGDISRQNGMKGGRPTKLTKHYLEVAEKVLAHDINCIILTDNELREEINENLPEIEQIAEDTWINWKKKNRSDKLNELDDIGIRFLSLMKKSLREQKKNLFKSLKLKSETQWQKYAWIIERKFDDWNIRLKSEIDLTSKDKELSALTGAAHKIMKEAIGK